MYKVLKNSTTCTQEIDSQICSYKVYLWNPSYEWGDVASS